MSFSAGETVGPYRIIEQLGQGGMATVYKAYHAALDRFVALKVLHPAFLEDSNFLARFQREARLVAKLDHPNIVPIYDYAEHEGRPYLVMKFIEGETLKARMAAGAIAPEETGRIVEAVGAALAYAHQHGILHRDVKPSNVLMAADGGIYLADFGLARIAAAGESTLSSDMIMGTPQYISPEQAMGKKELDEGTDIYSFGVMLYELVVGKVPFNADTPFSIIHDHIYTPLPLPRQVNPGVSSEIERVLLKALSKERMDRYKDVRSIVEAFNKAWQENPRVDADAATMIQTGSTTLTGVPVPASPRPSQVTAETAQAGAVVIPAAPVVPMVPKAVQKPGVKWMWMAAGVVLILGCLVTLVAVLSVRQPGRLASLRTARTGVPPATSTARPVKATQKPAAGGTTKNAPNVSQAIQALTQSPNDPNALIQMALAYEASNQPALAQEQITVFEKVIRDEATYWRWGQKLANAETWLLAARLCVDGAEMHQKSGVLLPDDLRDLFHQAVYKAFKNPAAVDYIPFSRLSKIDDPLARIAKSRFTFITQDQAQGQTLLNQLVKLEPNMPETQLLQAEFYALTGQPDAARKSLTQLKNNPAATEWMRAEANNIEGVIP